MKHLSAKSFGLCAVLALATVLGTAPAADAGHSNFVVSGYAGVNVWVDGGDVFNDYDDVTVWMRAERDCYSSLFLVDTAGYIHVLYPGASCDDGWVRGGATYCYRAGDLGLDRLDGRGIAYIFAVGSPAPFDYSPYGDAVFVGRFGYRITGDPFVACRNFYVSLLPAGCRWDYVGVGYARFYVREWVRYPSYLCVGGPGFHVRAGGGCRLCDDVYVSYRHHAAAPYEAIRPAPRYKQTYPTRDHATGRIQSGRSGRVADEAIGPAPTGTRNRNASFKQPYAARQSHKAAPVRVVSTSRTRASEAPREIRATGAQSRAPLEHSRQKSVAPDRKSTDSKAVRGASSSQDKGARKKVRQAQ
jgi:hypothetical protein